MLQKSTNEEERASHGKREHHAGRASQPAKRAPLEMSEPLFRESTKNRERAIRLESTIRRERAIVGESTAPMSEPVVWRAPQ